MVRVTSIAASLNLAAESVMIFVQTFSSQPAGTECAPMLECRDCQCCLGLQGNHCIVVVPVYQDRFTAVEAAALHVCSQRLQAYPIAIVHKRSSPVDSVRSLVEPLLCEQQQRQYVSVDDQWLHSVDSYNRMLLQAWFYHLFALWDYMLIFQLDAWIFRDNLDQWLARGYTYIGAPWIRALGTDTPDTGVGNGGLSLRHVKSFARILESPLNRYWPVFRWHTLAWRICLFRRYSMLPPASRPVYFAKRLFLFLIMSFGWHNTLAYFVKTNKLEDHFFSFFAPLVHGWMRVPSLQQAALFSIETNPRATLQWTGTLPFGCHAWQKHDPDVWLMQCPEEFKTLLP